MEISVFFYALAGFAIINIAFNLFLSKVGFSIEPQPQGNLKEAISVIVCSKNEQENLKILVPKLLEQDHPNFEIILINDASHDDTIDVIEEFMAMDHRIKMVDVVSNESFWGNKKYALTLGIKKAVNDHLIFIDADCTPNSTAWLTIISKHLSKEKTIVLGYSGYKKVDDSLLNKLIRYETVLTAIQYFSYAMNGNPYMGVGRNLAYTATQFYEVNGFMNHMRVLGGDDDLFVNQAATSQNTTVSLNQDSFTSSQPKTDWSSWWKQKKRHINTAKHYKSSHKFLLALFYISQIGFIISAILGLLFGINWIIILAVILVRYVVFWVVLSKGFSRFRESDIIIILPFLELILIGIQLALFISNMVHRPKQWN
ncbi:glycosyltransferase [Nonlabens sp. Ci31]|jgi:glycosyltransferase involved in cell wall biosynthesis|uniref:glycosyltransferase n=1 Tax=Nonlabens sp. Ci31 TaxID=2608253 RepID=UPI0014628237|nr:glycosyltransferase [Nonlabens sp. Ci31]QJP34441.1 glycosyltransferase [Nonlabens sp. Ci31]